MRKSLNISLKSSVQSLLLVLSFGYILFFFIKNEDTLQTAFLVDLRILTAILLLQLLFIVLQSWRFQIMIQKCSGIKLPFGKWLKIFILGRFLNLMFTQIGNIYRSVQLKNKYGITYTRYISAFTSMAWIDTCINLLLAVVVVIVTNSSFQVGVFVAWKILSLLFFICLMSPILFEFVLKRIDLKNSKLKWVHSKLLEVLRVTVANIRDPSFIGKIFALGLLLFIRTIIAFQLYFLIFDTHAPLAALVFFHAIFKLGFFITLTPGNLGVQEIAWGFLSEQMNLGMEEGILISGFSRVVSSSVLIISGFTLGGMDLVRQRKTLKNTGDGI